MPIYDMKFEDSIFYARETGHISKADAEMWAAQLARCASESSTPIAVLIDAREVEFISVDARMVFARAGANPRVKLAAVVNATPVGMQFSRMIELLSGSNTKHFFNEYDEAERFVRTQLLSVSSGR